MEYDEKKTTTRPKSRKVPKVTNGSSEQRENPASGGGPSPGSEIKMRTSSLKWTSH